MLRTSLRSARALRLRPIAAISPVAASLPARSWHPIGASSKRFFADAKPPNANPVLPTATEKTSAAPSSPIHPPSAATSPRKGGFFRKLRNYILTISIIGALAFGGGVWYARVNDNFHDFFTEYVPFGEQAVLYLEELDFRKRIPSIANRDTGKPRDTGANIRVPAQSGASWRVADSDGRQSAALVNKKAKPATPEPAVPAKEAVAEPKVAVAASAAPVSKPAKAAAPKPAAPQAEAAAAATTTAANKEATPAPAFKAPEVDEPSRWPPASPIDPLAVRDAAEPVVQDLVHMLNDIILVINADKAHDKYSAAIGKAKSEVDQVGQKIRAIREAAEQSAANQVRDRTDSFDKAAQDLVDRVEAAMVTQEQQWRKQYDAELASVRDSYEKRLALATSRERQLVEEELNNKLLEQAVQLTQRFSDELKARVEQEREGRLGKLAALSAEVADLERLTAGWTDVVDASQRAQQLHVAIDAVRSRVGGSGAADADGAESVLVSGGPFVKELVAIKEIAAADPVVDAAVASITPAAYQRGIASPAELIDRFRRVAAEVRKASLLPDDAGVASHASSYVLSKVLFKKQPGGSTSGSGGNVGDDVESVLTRTQAFLEEGNLDGAAREMNGLKGWAKTLSRDWLGEVRKVLEVQQALDVITAEARLRSLQLEKSQ